MEPLVVLVTGCSRGFGALTARELVERGHHVVATMREPRLRNRAAAEALEETSRAAAGRLVVLELDVTRDETVAAAFVAAREAFGPLDAVINNAGAVLAGITEAATPEDASHLFEVNFFGALRVTRAALPEMRARRRGLVVQVSSVAGRFVYPFFSLYSASKAALEAVSEAYRTELDGTNVDLVLVEPSDYATGLLDHVRRPSEAARAAEYGALAELPAALVAGLHAKTRSEGARDPREVARAIADLVEAPPGARPLRVPVPADDERLAALNALADAHRDELRAMLGLG